jgi:hypothetical protein
MRYINMDVKDVVQLAGLSKTYALTSRRGRGSCCDSFFFVFVNGKVLRNGHLILKDHRVLSHRRCD